MPRTMSEAQVERERARLKAKDLEIQNRIRVLAIDCDREVAESLDPERRKLYREIRDELGALLRVGGYRPEGSSSRSPSRMR